MDQIWAQLWNAGIPLFILAVGIVVVWKQWRADIAIGNQQRDAMVTAINSLGEKIDRVLPPKS
jgi:hypothetical protein